MIAIIVAYAQNRVIGRDGRIPWKIKGEQARFRQLTLGQAVVMGRRTYEEIGHPLPGRMNFVVSATQNFDAENCRTVASLTEAIALAGDRDLFVSGGAKLYAEALPLAEKLYITEIQRDVEGDTLFPAFDESLYDKTCEDTAAGDVPYTYVTYTRKAAGQTAATEV